MRPAAVPTIIEVPVRTPSEVASSTLTWGEEGNRAAGRSYTFEVAVNPRRGGDPERACRPESCPSSST